MTKTYEITCTPEDGSEVEITYTESDLFLHEYAARHFPSPRFPYMPEGFHLAQLPVGKTFHVREAKPRPNASAVTRMTVRVIITSPSNTPNVTIDKVAKYILSLPMVSMWCAFEVTKHNQLFCIRADGEIVYYLETEEMARKIISCIHNYQLN